MAKFFPGVAAIFCAALGGCAIAPPPTLPVSYAADGIPAASPMPQSSAPGPIPAGYIGFCLRESDQCELPHDSAATAQLTPSNWELLNHVNRTTNAAITYEDDEAHYGIADYWTIPTDGRGDCEDFAFTKRKALIDAGLPVAALRIAVVLTDTKERHAILTVATDRGDYVLDSMSDAVRPWTDTDYVWIERQDPKKMWAWDTINADTSATIGTAAPRPR